MYRRNLYPVTSELEAKSYWKFVSDGVDQNRATAGGFTRQTGNITFTTYIKIDKILWDVRNTGTYTLRFVTTVNGTTPLFVVCAGKSVDAAGEFEFIPDNGPFLVSPGLKFLQLNRDTGSAGWWDYNSAAFSNSIFSSAGCYYDTSSYANYNAPIKIVGRVVSYLFSPDV